MACLNLIKKIPQAICFAKSKKALALGYANRSAVYLEDRAYDHCLQNIEMARDGYPEDRVDKLNEREAKCKKIKEENANKPSYIPDKFFQLSYPPNPKVPFVIDCLEERDGLLFTSKDLKPGDIIAVEESVIKLLPRYGYVDRCYHCLRVNKMNLLPCAKTASLMFCSEECRKQPYDSRDEIDIFGLKKVVREGLDVFGQEGFEREILAGGFGYIVDKHPNFFDMDLSNNNPDRLKDWWRCTFNTFADSFKLTSSIWMRCQMVKDSKDPIYQDQFLSLYGILHMIPHSCAYNIEYYRYDGSKHVYYVTKPIKAGEQLFRNCL
jgi:hypothetical protein